MTLAIVLEDSTLIGPGLRWPLRIAALRSAEIVIVVPAREKKAVDLGAPDESPGRVAELAGLLDTYIGAGRWKAATDDEGAASSATSSDLTDVPIVAVELLPRDDVIPKTASRLQDRDEDMLIFVCHGERGSGGWWKDAANAFLSRTTCSFVYMVPGKREAPGEILTAACRGAHAQAALRLAAELGQAQERTVTALYVEPEIGPDARAVGRRILDRVVTTSAPEHAAEIRRRVEVGERVDASVHTAAAEDKFEVLVLGMNRLAKLSENTRSVGQRVHRKTEQPTLILMRSMMPLSGLVLRRLDGAIQRWVPQLGREGRTEFVDRVQPNSEWNFDFILLVALSSLIAAFGLIDDSAAVIIGAMLIAPLMTPLLGLGLALTQGNPLLARMSLKAVGLGFVTAFALSVAVGFLDPDFIEATPEMSSRDWPREIDLVIAFVSGLAAAYATGRPGLLAALPGVAIAAALLPPIATSGLALTVGDYDLALGAALLFAVNMVAIVLAAAAAIWAVGIRRLRENSLTMRMLGGLLVLTAVAMTVGMALAPPLSAPPAEFVEAVEAKLGDGVRLREVRIRRESTGQVVQIDLGGASSPGPHLAEALDDLAHEHLGKDYGVRLTYRYEVLVR